ncbi:MAG: hypothetical protein ACK4MQ_00225 [Hyphomonas sp.]
MTEADRPFSPDAETRIGDALAAAHSALCLTRRELEAAGEEPERWRWVALGLVSALQAALIAALSGYDTARLEDIANPSQPERAAPVALLLRRARSSEHLEPPERLALSAAAVRRLDTLIALRNAAVHGLGFRPPSAPLDLVRTGAGVIRHLLLDAPAFKPDRYGSYLSRIGQELTAIDRICQPDDPGLTSK